MTRFFNDEHAKLAELAAKLPAGCFIMGGAVRNILTSHPVKDIDIFIPRDVTWGRFADILDSVPVPWYEIDDNEDRQEAYDEVKGAGELEVAKSYWEDWNVDVIECDNLMRQLDRFPDDISQVWMAHSGAIFKTVRADLAFRSKRIEIEARCQKPRVQRLRELYPDWAIYLDGQRLPPLGQALASSPSLTKKAKRALNPDYAPNWWDLPEPKKLESAAVEAMRALSEAYR